MTTPTAMLMLPPLTADRTCPPMMQSMVQYPTISTICRKVHIFDGSAVDTDGQKEITCTIIALMLTVSHEIPRNYLSRRTSASRVKREW